MQFIIRATLVAIVYNFEGGGGATKNVSKYSEDLSQEENSHIETSPDTETIRRSLTKDHFCLILPVEIAHFLLVHQQLIFAISFSSSDQL